MPDTTPHPLTLDPKWPEWAERYRRNYGRAHGRRVPENVVRVLAGMMHRDAGGHGSRSDVREDEILAMEPEEDEAGDADMAALLDRIPDETLLSLLYDSVHTDTPVYTADLMSATRRRIAHLTAHPTLPAADGARRLSILQFEARKTRLVIIGRRLLREIYSGIPGDPGGSVPGSTPGDGGPQDDIWGIDGREGEEIPDVSEQIRNVDDRRVSLADVGVVVVAGEPAQRQGQRLFQQQHPGTQGVQFVAQFIAHVGSLLKIAQRRIGTLRSQGAIAAAIERAASAQRTAEAAR